MRFQQFVEYAVNPSVQRNYGQIRDLAVHIHGGWEVWLQVEIYLTLRSQIGDQATFIREPHFPHSAKRADFSFVPRNADLTTTWVELKVQTRGNALDAINRFGSDIDKLGDISLPPNDTAGAIVCIATNVQDGLDYARQLFAGIRSRIRYYLIAPDAIKGYYLGDQVAIRPGDFAVIYYTRN